MKEDEKNVVIHQSILEQQTPQGVSFDGAVLVGVPGWPLGITFVVNLHLGGS